MIAGQTIHACVASNHARANLALRTQQLWIIPRLCSFCLRTHSFPDLGIDRDHEQVHESHKESSGDNGALEYTLKYWLKSFTRDQFKLQGRTVNGTIIALSCHAICQQSEPVVVQIDKIDLVLEENPDADVTKGPSSAQSPTGSRKSNGYGFADKVRYLCYLVYIPKIYFLESYNPFVFLKQSCLHCVFFLRIADGMTLLVKVVGLTLLYFVSRAAPLASITIRNLVLYTTNESWKVVNLKEARDFSTNKGFIYLFKKLEWEALSVDLLPHPDMFTDANLARSEEENLRDDDGASKTSFLWRRTIFRRNFWPSTCKTFITVQRTALNSPLGLEVQLHIPEAVCPALSEPGLRALLRFLTGMYLCLNRGDVDPKSQQSAEAAGRYLLSVLVDHVFLCIKDAEFQLDLLMQSLLFSRGCFSRSPCALVQPSMKAAAEDLALAVPDFGINNVLKPSHLFSKTVIQCQPLMVCLCVSKISTLQQILQEEACLRISSVLADGIVVMFYQINPLTFFFSPSSTTWKIQHIFQQKRSSLEQGFTLRTYPVRRRKILFAKRSGLSNLCLWIMMSACVENLTVSKPYLFDPSLYLKALKLCSYQTMEKQFVLIHGNSVTNGFISNLHLNNSLVNLYARHEDMKHARKLFDRMSEIDVVSWTAMISGYSRCGYHRSALMLFKQMRRESIRANDFTYGSMSCKDLGCLKEGTQIHGCVEKGRFAGNLVVRSALLSLYPKFGKMEDACLLFDSVKERDLVSWNIMIDGYTADTSFGLFQLMLAEGNLRDKRIRTPGIPSRCWCGVGVTEIISRSNPNPYRRYYRCLFAASQRLENDNHVFKWVDEAFTDEIQQLNYQVRMLKEEVQIVMLSRGEKWFNLGGVSNQSSNNTHQINLSQSKLDMDSLPPSMLHKILSTVATMNIRNFSSARIAFPGFNEVGREDHFYRSANLIYLNDWVDEVSAVRTFRLKCYRSVDEGREKIHLAGERGCELAQFVDGMLNLAFSVDHRGIVHNYPAFTRQHVYKMFQIICSWQLSGHWDYDKPGMFLSVAERIDPNVPCDCWCSHIDPPEFEVSLDGSRSRDPIWLDSFEMVSELHGFATNIGFGRSNVALIRSLTDVYAKCGSLSSALKLV
ncbi:LOW QUALITY PROTEIN: hypothetical protein HID58_096322 [Brassica napus]|uniref:GRF-type domain-containing protein n=1 Tax=Brassica napus TaxID=3708 RepID=A0ABQ7X2X2_BRANA|nr:LOW QUALITY PROTEIN: hypothetical protein HID58_096322 [Brassica napus]